MTGSKQSAMLFLAGGVMWIVQAMVSLVFFDDSTGALIEFIVIIPMVCGILFAWQGGLRRPMEYVGSHEDWDKRMDTCQVSQSSWQGAAYCGFCIGILAIVLAFAAGQGLLDLLGIGGVVYLLPGLIGGVLAILDSVVYRLQVKGPYFTTPQVESLEQKATRHHRTTSLNGPGETPFEL